MRAAASAQDVKKTTKRRVAQVIENPFNQKWPNSQRKKHMSMT